jgi:outer membrane protein OmpA-like peptidoglycan-associated protein
VKNFLVKLEVKQSDQELVVANTTPSQAAMKEPDIAQDVNQRNVQPRITEKTGERTVSFPTGNLGQNNTSPRINEESNIAPVNYSVGKKVIIHNVYFNFGTTGVTEDSDPVLEELYQSLVRSPNLKVEIGGHTDNIGSAEVNLWISGNRAKKIRNWLIKRGINGNRLVARGYGASRPLASNDDEEDGRELNRRIEIRVIN